MQSRLKKALPSLSFLAIIVLGACAFRISIEHVYAETADQIRAKIADNNQKIADLQKQIDDYSTLLNSTSKQAQTLKNALATLQLTQRKLEADLSLTTSKINKTNLTIQNLAGEISDTEDRITGASDAIAQNIRDVSSEESQSAIEELLNNKSISDAFDHVNALETIQGRIKTSLDNLKDLHDELNAQKDEAAGEKAKLLTYQKTLSDQQKVVASNKAEKDKLLADTQNKEANYKTILAGKVSQREAYEKELLNYESQLKVTIDPSSIPNSRSGVLSWPVDNVFVTQYFGRTPEAAKLYKTTASHGGIDLRASIGTPIKAALLGTVTDTEAIKSKSGCQYGKYVLIKHPNGLSTIYGHLSVVSVKPGDTVTTGQVIGYSGDTGYATGPHLHFGVYATAGVRVVDSSALGSSSCAGIKTVAAPTSAYLDPLAYLPKL